MARERKQVGLVGIFDTPQDLVRAARVVQRAQWRYWDCHAPHPVPGLDEAMGLPESRLARYALCVGGVFAALGLAMQGWMSAVDYPLRVGGKPYFSGPSFVPIVFELFVLASALAATGLLVKWCRLWRWYSPLHVSGVMPEVVSHRYAIALYGEAGTWDEARARALLGEAGCRDIRPLFEQED